MLVLAMLGLLATAGPADTSVRVPGTALRFGLADTLAAARGFAAAGAGDRKGRCPFFGLASEARLSFTAGRLARVELAVEQASPHELAYVQDQLAAMGYRRRCQELRPASSDCDWTGGTRVRIVAKGARLVATVTPREPAAPGPGPTRCVGTPGVGTPAGAGAVPVAAPPRATAPVLPETLAVSVPGRPSPHAEATVVDAPRCRYPAAAHEAGVQGRVWVLVLVDVDGQVLEASVTRGIGVLNAAALECVRGWKFGPRTWQGAPCRYRVEVPLAFTLD